MPAGRLAGRLSVILQRALTRLAGGRRRARKLGESPYTLLTTFRPDGRPVAVPVWAAMEGDRLYVRTERASGKVRRLERDGRAEVAPASAGGRSLGPARTAAGRVLGPDEEAIAERALARRYGLLRAAFERSVDLMRVDMCYLELRLTGDADERAAEHREADQSAVEFRR